ncbi:DUF1499 domain-containing protein [Aurantimonas sp. VKM B-3413]|uniref:DUF1499 domain-containing protein n=1 Tax=Aurantimonas sp. VKM B-3413 TaxID=2779401 RepID=UPI001E654C1C|nr:DUF1499 domain-containing protein [Aurantimonas sp. VKM B-3413]MCB8836513.1 DUF1499 domain-containing protein [Aurantimonas sp. VKM B-3413]
MKLVTRIAAALGLAALLATVGLFAIGRDRVWKMIAGPADQGPADFANLERRASGNDALACSPGACGPLKPDVILPVVKAAPPEILRSLDRILLAEPGAERVDGGKRPGYRRYVVRTRILRFPDTVDAEAVATMGGTALKIYSRSLLGRGDFGANRRRLEAIAERLEAGTTKP